MRSLSIVIPAYNEERRLPSTLVKVSQYVSARPWDFLEVLVVNDGSRDGTARLVNDFRTSHPAFRVLENPGNRGKGYSVRHGMLEAKGDWVLFSDADLSAPIEELDKLYNAAKEAGASLALGSRALDRSLIAVHQPAFREYAGRFFNLVMRGVTALPYWDTQCGFKLFTRDAAQQVFRRQKLDGFGFDVEALVIAQLLGIKAVEVPVRWSDVEGTKVSMRHGLNGFADLARVRWNQIKGLYR